MNWQILISGISIGFISSFHCVGMCGPIAISLPVYYLPNHQKFFGILLYNFGRITVYSILGLLFGALGSLIFIQGFEKWFSIIMGIIVLLTVIQFYFIKRYWRISFLNKFNLYLQQFIGTYIKKKQLYGMFLIGVANGLLPCGMVYFAIAAALATGSIGGSITLMVFFGIGTLPLMALLSNFGFVISISLRNKMKQIVPYFMAIMAILLILRGMDLGIPYLSPSFSHSSNAASCNH